MAPTVYGKPPGPVDPIFIIPGRFLASSIRSLNEFQGMSVFAVGSPLGLADAMTKGVVTRVRRDHIMTDAKILPGNSGGPLITEDGKVIGINTLKLARNADAEGFGLAIPVRVASQQFPQMHQR